MYKKIICIFVSLILLVSTFCISVSAESNYTEYFEYSGQAISSSVSNTLQAYAFNYMNDTLYGNENAKYWAGIRVGQYQYLLWIFYHERDLSFSYGPQLINGYAFIYDERMYSYVNDNRTYYQAGFREVSLPCTVEITRNNLIGNFYGTMAVNPVADNMSYDKLFSEFNLNLKYILYTLIFLCFFL